MALKIKKRDANSSPLAEIKAETFFYDNGAIFATCERFLKTYNIDNEYVDVVTVQKWIKTFYFEKGYDKSDSLTDRFDADRVDFHDFLSMNDVGVIDRLSESILVQCNFVELQRYFELAAKKYNYNKSHFKNSKYILAIHTGLNALNYVKNMKGFDFHVPNSLFKKVDDSLYFWNMYESETKEYGVDTNTVPHRLLVKMGEKYELRRVFNASTDDQILKDWKLEKVVYAIKIEFGTLFFQTSQRYARIPYQEWPIIRILLIELYKNFKFFRIDFNSIIPDEYFYAASLCQDLEIDMPLKIYVQPGVMMEHQFYDRLSKDMYFNVNQISVTDFGIFFKFPRLEILNLVDYVTGLDDEYVLSALSLDVHSKFNSHFIWQDVIDWNTLSTVYEFHRSAASMEFFKNNFVYDYFLTDALMDIAERHVIERVASVFKIGFDIRTNSKGFELDISYYVKKLLQHYDFDYMLPNDGWEILNEHFKIYNSIQLPDVSNEMDEIYQFARDEATNILITYVNRQVTFDAVRNEMFEKFGHVQYSLDGL